MDYASRDAAQQMMDTLPQDAAWLEQEIARLEAENAEKKIRFVVQDRSDFDLGSKRIHYSCVHALGVFQLDYSDLDHYKYNPVLFFNRVRPIGLRREIAFWRIPAGWKSWTQILNM